MGCRISSGTTSEKFCDQDKGGIFSVCFARVEGVLGVNGAGDGHVLP